MEFRLVLINHLHTIFGKTSLLEIFDVGEGAFDTAKKHYHKFMKYDKTAIDIEERETSPLKTEKRGKKGLDENMKKEIREWWYHSDVSRSSMGAKCTDEKGVVVPRYNLIYPARWLLKDSELIEKYSRSTIMKYRPKCVKGPLKKDGFCTHCKQHANAVIQLKKIATMKKKNDETDPPPNEHLPLDPWKINENLPKLENLHYKNEDKPKVEAYLKQIVAYTDHMKLRKMFENRQASMNLEWPKDTGTKNYKLYQNHQNNQSKLLW